MMEIHANKYTENCSKCNGIGRVKNEEGAWKRCSCTVKSRIDHYIQSIGHLLEPSSTILSILQSFDGSFLTNLWIDIESSYLKNEQELNGLLAYLLIEHVYPQDYKLYNISELRKKITTEQDWSAVESFNQPFFILTAGLQSEFTGYTKEGTKWTDEARFNMTKQLIGYRFRKGLYTWYISVDNPYKDVEKLLQQNSFKHLEIKDKTKQGLSEV